MDSKAAVDHAQAVAREALRCGLAEQAALARSFNDYRGQLSPSGPVRLSFTEFLLSRGTIDRQGFARLESAVPAESASSNSSSGHSPALPRGRQTSEFSAVLEADLEGLEDQGFARAGPAVRETDEYSEVLEAIDLKGRQTVAFKSVLGPANKRQVQDGLRDETLPLPEKSTDEFGKVLAPDDEAPFGLLSQEPPPPPRDVDPMEIPLGDSTVRAASPVLESPRPAARPAARPPSGRQPPERASRPSERQGRHGSGSRAGSGSGQRTAPVPSLPVLGPGEAESEAMAIESFDRLPTGEREPREGDEVGGYVLERVLGRGGMGVIYRAHKIDAPEAPLAIKILLSGEDEGDLGRRRQRFRREFEALRRLEHSQIVRVHDYGRHGNFDWYVMDYVKGYDLEQVLLRGSLDFDGLLGVLEDVCQAMAHAHERQVVHRDLKPQNVLVDDRGRGYVLDFGLAKILDQSARMTRVGSALGTAYYIAPEQLRSAGEATAPADVFALGVLVYEVATGQRPFRGKNAAEIGNKILNEDPPPPSRLDPKLPRELDTLCAKALNKKPGDRHADAAELLEDLLRVRQAFELRGRAKQSQGGGGLRRALVVLLLILLAVGLAVLAVLLYPPAGG